MAQNFSNTKQKELVEQFLDEEPLFLLLYDELNELIESQNIRFSIAEIWFDAKDLVKSIFKSKHPDKLLATHYHQIEENYKQFNPVARDVNSPTMPVLKQDIPQGEQDSAVNLIVLCSICILYYYDNSSNDVVIRHTYEKLINYLRNDYYSFVTSWSKMIKREGGIDVTFYDFDYKCAGTESAYSNTTDMEGNNDNIDNEDRLCQLLEDPVNSLCYDFMQKALGGITWGVGVEFEADTYVNIFNKAYDYFNQVKNAKIKDIRIKNIHGEILREYRNNEDNNALGGKFSSYIGSAIEMTFYVLLSKKITNKDERFNKAMVNIRSYIRHCSYTNGSNDLYNIVQEAITETYDKIDNDELKAQLKQKDEIIANKDAELVEKDKEIEMAHAGWDKIEDTFTTKAATKRVAVLKYLLGMPNQLIGDERKEFQKLCTLETKCTDTTFDRLLSNNSLVMMEERIPELLEEYPILQRLRNK